MWGSDPHPAREAPPRYEVRALEIELTDCNRSSD
jgi:hypothetical protein